MVLSVVVAATILVAAAAAWGCRGSWKDWSRGDRVRAALAVPALFCVLLTSAYAIARTQSDVWSYIRLMPSVALTRGYALYYPDGEGPLLGWLYGPVVPILQLPIALLPHPSAALTGAGLLSTAMLLIPLYLAILRAMPAGASHRVSAFLVLAALHAILLHLAPGQYWFRGIQVDGFAMGFWLLGIVVLLGAETTGRRRLWVSALLFTAAMFSKHPEAVLAPIPVIFLWAREGRAAALRLAFAIGALSTAMLLLSSAVWGWNAVVLNMWRVPAGHPWAKPGLIGLAEAAQHFFDIAQLLFAGVAAMAVIDLRLDPRGRVREALLARPWILPAAASLVILPVSFVGWIKIGGDNNGLHAVYFLAATAGMIAGRWMEADRPAGLRAALCAVVMLATLCGTILGDRGPAPLDEQFRDSRMVRDYRFSREHPEEVWFGTNPLVCLYTDRKAYHQGYGVYDRQLARIPPSAAYLKSVMPARLRWVESPGAPFWMPENCTRVAAPPGLGYSLWYEPAR